MTVTSETARNNYIGNGATSVYSYGFKIFSNTDLLVTKRDTSNNETTLVVNTDYTVAGVGDTAGGSITLTAGNLPSSYVLTIRRQRSLLQGTDIRNQGDFFPEVHEDSFDSLVMIDQTQQDEIDRSIRLPETVTGVSMTLPIPVANTAIGWNATADAITNIADIPITANFLEEHNANGTHSDIAAATIAAATIAAATIAATTITAATIAATTITAAVINYAADTGTADVYAATLSPAAGSYATGMEVNVKITNANLTTTPTLNVNALGAKTIKRGNSATLLVGDLPANHQAKFRYNGTDMILLNPANVSTTDFTNANHTHANAAGGGNTLTIPTIADFTNANHTHADAAGGGTITWAQTAGDYLLNDNDTERPTAPTTYTKSKETKLGVGGVLRIKFSLKRVSDAPYGKIYRNGVAVGTERSTGSTTYVEFSEDIGGWSPGDLVQIYTHSPYGTGDAYVANLRIYSAAPPIAGRHVSY